MSMALQNFGDLAIDRREGTSKRRSSGFEYIPLRPFVASRPFQPADPCEAISDVTLIASQNVDAKVVVSTDGHRD